MNSPGAIALFGSGETGPHGRKVHEHLMGSLTPPIRVAILDTPAGFELNVDLVADKIKRFFDHHLQNFHPEVFVVKARGKGDAFDPDNPLLVDALLEANYIFAGPGSPTYAIRHLVGTRALANLVVRHHAGAILALASAAAAASGSFALPVYEIFKAGHELHWVPGLGLFREHGLDLAVVTHWDNKEGGSELDTSRCYMGEARFRKLLGMLPTSMTVLGLDEHTACILDFAADECTVMGLGSVTVLAGGVETSYGSGMSFQMGQLRQ